MIVVLRTGPFSFHFGNGNRPVFHFVTALLILLATYTSRGELMMQQCCNGSAYKPWFTWTIMVHYTNMLSHDDGQAHSNLILRVTSPIIPPKYNFPQLSLSAREAYPRKGAYGARGIILRSSNMSNTGSVEIAIGRGPTSDLRFS